MTRRSSFRPRDPRRLAVVAAALSLVAAWPVASRAYEANSFVCGSLHPPGQYGPFDYRTIPETPKGLVESAHFTPSVEAGIAGNAGSVGSDTDYTLRAIPNHPRALLAMTRYANRMHTDRPDGAHYTVECYYERAIRMAPDDPMPHALYGAFLKDHKRVPQAKAQLLEAENLRGDPATFDLDYNLGLLFLDVGEPDRAMTAARRAYALGAPFPALMKRLKAAGKWSDAAPAPKAAAPAATPAATPVVNDAAPTAPPVVNDASPAPAPQ